MSQKEVKELIRRLRKLGVVVEERQDYWRVTCPDGSIVRLHKTPSDHRHLLNARARLRRGGVNL